MKGWLEARDIPVDELDVRGLPVLIAGVGPEDAPRLVLHGHLDVVPGREEQFRRASTAIACTAAAPTT